MEFDFDVSSVLSGRISHLQPSDLAKLAPMRSSCMRQMIDTMGRLSAEAQELPTIITTYSKFTASPDQHLYVMREPTPGSKNQPCRVLGFIKVGVKDLFFHDETGNWSEKLQPFCLLDFYVHETQQRRGLGLELINFMLKELPVHANLSVKPPMLASYFAYDRPSPKLLRFLKKHFGLDPPIEQTNNFVVYGDFFRSNPVVCVDAASNAVTGVTADKRVKHFGYTLDNKNNKHSNKSHGNNKTNIVNSHSIVNSNKTENSPSRSSGKTSSAGNRLLETLSLNRENSALKRQQSQQQRQQPQQQLQQHGQRIDKMSHVYSRHEYPSQDRSVKKAPPVTGRPTVTGVQQATSLQQQQQRQPPSGLVQGSLRPPFACQADLQEEINSDWRSGSNKRFQRTALW